MPSVLRSSPLLPVWSVAAREWLRFVRQRNRVVGAVGQPVLFWLFFGAGLGPTFRLPGEGGESAAGVSFLEYFFPGTLVLILLFTAIFTTISIIEDRREGFLQAVLVAPMPRAAMVLGKLLGGTAIAFAQGMLFLLLGFTLDWELGPAAVLHAAAFSFVTAVGLTGLGFVIAWRMDSTQGFHAIMSVFLLPMWLLSGAFFPLPDNWLGAVMRCNPLTYAVAGLRRVFYAGEPPGGLTDSLPSLPICWGVTAGFALLTFAASCWIARGRTRGDLL